MKVQILHLEPHDDLTSIRDRLAWAQAPRVVLVWPPRGEPLKRRIDLALARQAARRRGLEIGLITFDPEVRAHAQSLGVPVFESTDEATLGPWRVRRARPPRPLREGLPPARPLPEVAARPLATRARPLSLGLLGLALLAIAAFFVPGAQVVVEVPTQEQQATLTLTLDPQARELDGEGRVPARAVETEVEASVLLPTTGRVEVPGASAHGQVRLVNLTEAALTVPAGSGVRSTREPALRFLTRTTVFLPPGPGTEAVVEVEAAEPGTQGNLPPGTLDALEGDLGLQVQVVQEEPTGGGTSRRVSGVSAADRVAAERALREAALEQAAARLQADLEEDEVLLQEGLRLVEVTEEVYSQEIGQAATAIEGRLKGRVVGLAYRPADLETAVRTLLDGQVPRGWTGVPDSLAFEVRQARPSGEGRVVLSVRAERSLARQFDRQGLAWSLRGLTPEGAVQLMEREFQVSPLQITLFPGWFPRLPFHAPRIQVLAAWEVGP